MAERSVGATPAAAGETHPAKTAGDLLAWLADEIRAIRACAEALERKWRARD